MAFTDMIIDGGDILLKVNGEIMACATSHTIEITNATREISCKGSGDWTSAEYGRFSWTVSTDALLNLVDDAQNPYVTYPELLDLMINKTFVDVESYYEDRFTGDTMIVAGQAIITSVSQTAGDSENASYSVSMQGRGELVITSTAQYTLSIEASAGQKPERIVIEELNKTFEFDPDPVSGVQSLPLPAGTYNVTAYYDDAGTSLVQTISADLSMGNASVDFNLA